MIHLIPGDPVQASLGVGAPAAAIAARRKQLGLDEPILEQYAHFITGVLHGDLGESIITGLPVSSIISDRIGATLVLAFGAFAVCVIIGLTIGVVMAALTHSGSRPRTDLSFSTGMIVLGAIPDFVLAVALVWIFGVEFAWLPVAGNSGIQSGILPIAALALPMVGFFSRIARVELVNCLHKDFVRTARSKRLPSSIIYFRYAIPNAITSTMTYAGILLSAMLVGTVLVESIFAWPGLGADLVESIKGKDYPLVQGLILVYGGLILIINLCVDIALAILDRRKVASHA